MVSERHYVFNIVGISAMARPALSSQSPDELKKLAETQIAKGTN
jgi:hypothetical protein